MAERLRAPSPMEAAAKTRGNAKALRSSRSDVIRRGRERGRLCLVTFRLLCSAPERCSKRLRSQLSRIALSSSSDPTRPPLIARHRVGGAGEEAAETFQLPPAKKIKKTEQNSLSWRRENWRLSLPDKRCHQLQIVAVSGSQPCANR